MEALIWMVLLAYSFGIGYLAVRRIAGFIQRNPKAFPAAKQAADPSPAFRHSPPWEEGNCCLRPPTNLEETESYEQRDP